MPRTSSNSKKATPRRLPKIPYQHKPEGLELEDWQTALRKQFVIDKPFGIIKLDENLVFGDYEVYNPESKNNYKVAIRSNDNTLNFCSCLDFKTNHLGTCKHIEAVKYKIEQSPKLVKLFQKDYSPPYTSVYLSYQGERCVKVRVGTNHSDAYASLVSKYCDTHNTFLPESYMVFEQFISEAKRIDGEFRCYDDAMAFILEYRENQRRAKLIQEGYSETSKLDGLINGTLFPYQKEGILFAAKVGRCMIADEMGLGKTIQAIAAAELIRKETLISNVLIVCPTSLKYQWESEIKKFTSSSVRVIEGLQHQRDPQYRSDEYYKIVSYHTLKNDIDIVNSTEVDLVILDEAQRIKNWKTKLAQGVKKVNTRYSIVLTGTPLENKLEELYSIIQFIDPFKLGPYYKFLDYYQIKNPTGKVVGYKHLNEIGELLSDIMIRRSKKEVLTQLPERIDKNLLMPMTQAQKDSHEAYASVVAKLVHKWKRLRFLSEQDRQKLLINLNLMRMVCDSTYVVDQQTRHDTKVDELLSILNDYFDGNKEKAVIFSQWERMTRIIAQELDKQGIRYEYLHGGVPSIKRKGLFDRFNRDESVRVFLSTDAGSTGLNLQTASLLINVDIPWNPAVLEQRIGRIHRMGQKNNITVLNFVSIGTIEHRMLDVLKFKKSLAEGILDQGEDSIFLSDSKFNEFMRVVGEMSEQDPERSTQIGAVSSDIKDEQKELRIKEDSVDEPESRISGLGDMDDAEGQKPMKHSANNSTMDEINPTELITKGIDFIGGLAKTLSSPEATEKLVSSLVEQDESTGKSYLKIPIENQATVSTALTALAKLFGGVKP